MQTDLIPKSHWMFDTISSENTVELGETMHEAMLAVANRGGFVPLTIYICTPTKIVTTVLDGETSKERLIQAKQFGRDASHEFGKQLLHYIVTQSMCVSSTEENVLPNDDPHRKECCYTFAAPILDVCLARSVPEHIKALMLQEQKVWSSELHEGMPIKTINEASTVITTINHELGRYNKEDTNIAVIDNNILTEVMIGLSPSFQAVSKTHTDETPLEAAIKLELMKKQADETMKELYPKA